jgi:urease accessory protein
VRSRLEIVAEVRGGRTVVSRISGGGHFAARLTGPGELHLVGTAAGPLGGDEATVAIEVLPGARLRVRSAGATIVQPGLHDPFSRLDLRLGVATGGFLEVAMEPTVVTAGASHLAVTSCALENDARVRVVEHVLLGRSGEGPGDWTGRLAVTRDGSPVVRHTVRSELMPGVRVVSTLFDSGASAAAATHGGAVAMPLAAGGALATATGSAYLPVRADLEAVVRQFQPAEVTATA